MRTRRGFFVSIEGVDGAGKSTQVGALATALAGEGRDVVTVRPDDTHLGALVHGFLLERRDGNPLDPWAEALLFNAGRAQLVRECIAPALDRGAVVVADRYADSTLAYQGGGRGLSREVLRRLHADACGDLWPDLTVLLELPLPSARRRQESRQMSLDRFELAPGSFHAAVAAAFDGLAADEPQRFVRIDAARPAAVVSRDIVAAVCGRIP